MQPASLDEPDEGGAGREEEDSKAQEGVVPPRVVHPLSRPGTTFATNQLAYTNPHAVITEERHMSDSGKYRGKVVVVTGASSGFGRGTALELARRGASVVLAARSAETLQGLARECEGAGGRAVAVPTDVSDRAAVEGLAEKAVAAFGHFDCWINDAGVASIGRFDEVPMEDHEQVIRTDPIGTVAGSHCAMKHFRQRGAGTLINVASVIGKIPAPYYASYAAAKFGVVGLGDALRQELSQEGVKDIRVCTVMPMAHSTEFFEHAGNYTGKEARPIPPTYDPKVTIDKLVQLVVEPEDEVITGWQGTMFNFFHKLMPNVIEKVMGANTAKTQLKDPPPASKSSGTVHQPLGR
jgi:short-subunit dehydrogenase